MKNPLLLLALTALLWAGCGSVPLTGRRQLLLVSDQEVLSSSLTQYNDYMKTAPRSSSAKQADRGLPPPERTGLRSEELPVGVQPRGGQAGERLLHARRQDCGL